MRAKLIIAKTKAKTVDTKIQIKNVIFFNLQSSLRILAKTVEKNVTWRQKMELYRSRKKGAALCT